MLVCIISMSQSCDRTYLRRPGAEDLVGSYLITEIIDLNGKQQRAIENLLGKSVLIVHSNHQPMDRGDETILIAVCSGCDSIGGYEDKWKASIRRSFFRAQQHYGSSSWFSDCSEYAAMRGKITQDGNTVEVTYTFKGCNMGQSELEERRIEVWERQ